MVESEEMTTVSQAILYTLVVGLVDAVAGGLSNFMGSKVGPGYEPNECASALAMSVLGNSIVGATIGFFSSSRRISFIYDPESMKVTLINIGIATYLMQPLGALLGYGLLRNENTTVQLYNVCMNSSVGASVVLAPFIALVVTLILLSKLYNLRAQSQQNNGMAPNNV